MLLQIPCESFAIFRFQKFTCSKVDFIGVIVLSHEQHGYTGQAEGVRSWCRGDGELTTRFHSWSSEEESYNKAAHVPKMLSH